MCIAGRSDKCRGFLSVESTGRLDFHSNRTEVIVLKVVPVSGVSGVVDVHQRDTSLQVHSYIHLLSRCLE